MGNHPAYISTAVAYPFIKNLPQNCDIYRKRSFGLFIFLFILRKYICVWEKRNDGYPKLEVFLYYQHEQETDEIKKSKWSLIIPQRYKKI